jgi:hypothetical protein
MLEKDTGVTMTTMNYASQRSCLKPFNYDIKRLTLNAQFTEVPSALAGAWILDGTISAGYNQVIPSHPIAKNVLNMDKKAAVVTPVAVPLALVVPARTAIETAMPAAPNSINGRRPNFSMVNTAIHDAREYLVPLAAVRMRDMKASRPMYCS